jgi:hypothetical protein
MFVLLFKRIDNFHEKSRYKNIMNLYTYCNMFFFI